MTVKVANMTVYHPEKNWTFSEKEMVSKSREHAFSMYTEFTWKSNRRNQQQ
jgi:hypothetical protein